MAANNIIVYDKYIVGHKTFASLQKCIPLHDYSPNGVPTLFIVSLRNLDSAWKKLHSIEPVCRRDSLVININHQGQKIYDGVPPGIAVVSVSSSESLKHLVRIALGEIPQFFDPAWFCQYPASETALSAGQHWVHALRIKKTRDDSLVTIHPDHTIESLAEQLDYSINFTAKQCRQLFGIPPGELLRLRRLFFYTANCMRQERLITEHRRGFSPLIHMPGEYRKSLKRTMGLTYTDFRLLAEKEHWLAVWGRHWRNLKIIN